MTFLTMKQIDCCGINDFGLRVRFASLIQDLPPDIRLTEIKEGLGKIECLILQAIWLCVFQIL